jgi:hypothetical protein
MDSMSISSFAGRELAKRRYKRFMATASPEKLAQVEGKPEWADEQDSVPERSDSDLGYAYRHGWWPEDFETALNVGKQ